MTIAIAIKVNDGLVLASDSRTSFIDKNNAGKTYVVHAYDNANKIVNLHKGLPLGMVTCGVGGIGPHSIATLAKDFRSLISGTDPGWRVDPQSYTVEQVAASFHRFIYTDHYLPAFSTWPQKPTLVFLLGGFSAGGKLAELWEIRYNDQGTLGPTMLQPQEAVGISWDGEQDPLSRLIHGYGLRLPSILEAQGLAETQVQSILSACAAELEAPMVSPAMPIQDAINLAKFLVETTREFTKYIPGGSTVGGPVEVSAITKHEGFKWVQRKHYFDVSLNPQRGGVMHGEGPGISGA